jgi:protoporphyrinogen oxidase
VAAHVKAGGGMILTGYVVNSVITDGHRVRAVGATNVATGQRETFQGDYFFSTAPIRDLLRAFDVPPPAIVREVSEGLVYRDFITVGLLVNRLKLHEDGPQGKRLIADNWIYIQEPDVLVGRLQIFNNWSPYMVADPSRIWLGLEYFCNDTDALWQMPEDELIALAKTELSRIGIIDAVDVLDATVLKMEKTYPAYFGTYNRFDEIRRFVDRFENLFLIGRNGMHKYNNQDHSMLTAMRAVDNIIAGVVDKSNVWEVNTEQDYHEDKAGKK